MGGVSIIIIEALPILMRDCYAIASLLNDRSSLLKIK
jgi:hypothetical protein